MNIGTNIGFGLLTGATLMLPALALAIQIKVMRFFNLSYGDFIAFAAFLTLFFNHLLGLNVILAGVLSLPLVSLFGILIHKFVFRPLQVRGANSLTLLVASVGVAFVIRNLILLWWGPNPQQYKISLQNSLAIGPFLWTPTQMFSILMAITAVLGIYAMLTYTRMGRMMRAIADNIELAKIRGIDTDRVVNHTWFISSCLAGVGGILIGLMGTLTSDMGTYILLLLFVSLITGGIGSPYGAALGAIVIGISLELSTFAGFPEYKLAIAYLLMFIILIVKPTGIFSRS